MVFARVAWPEGGFTLVELLIVVLLIGVMTSIAVPQYFKIVEKGKTSEGTDFLDALLGAQQRYNAKYGVYCTAAVAACPGFDLTLPTLKYFNAFGGFAPGAVSWKATLTRNSAPVLYGAYTLTYDPGTAPPLQCSQANCTTDLLPTLN